MTESNQQDTALPTPVEEGALLWTPSDAFVKSTMLHRYLQWLEENKSLCFDSYAALWEWSVTDLSGFWQSIWEFFELISSQPHRAVIEDDTMPGARWFPGARLNYAEHALRHETPGENALLYLNETQGIQGLDWQDLGDSVRKLATYLREQGVAPGDRVVAYMPNIPETVMAMLATTAIGATWASCSPDFGSDGVLDRVSQLQPTVIITCDGYVYGGKSFSRCEEVKRICSSLQSLKEVILFPNLDAQAQLVIDVKTVLWQDIMSRPVVSRDEFEFEQVAFDHPLWILFSSGTTGLPKAIVHGHGGIVIETVKGQAFHMDFRPRDVVFFYTTTGWMMWNSLVSSLISNVCPVLYDGNPSYPDLDILWRMVQDSGASLFGSSPAFVDIMRKEGVVPKERYDLGSLRTIMPAGAIVTPACTAWFYENVKEDLWIASGSGGTDICTGLVGGVPTLPVRAGEIQAPSLGVAARAFNDAGESVINEVGELVITKPMPSMPVFFWNDEDGQRYRDSYFDQFPGVWRHGDFFKVNERGSCYVLGRSDATLNRYGIRIGTAEVYRAVEDIPQIIDTLVVNLDLPGGKAFMPMFVQVREGEQLTDEVIATIKKQLRERCTPRHVPDKILQVDAIPMTLTGKKMEVPVRKILMGADPAKAVNLGAMKNPETIPFYIEYAASGLDYTL